MFFLKDSERGASSSCCHETFCCGIFPAGRAWLGCPLPLCHNRFLDLLHTTLKYDFFTQENQLQLQLVEAQTIKLSAWSSIARSRSQTFMHMHAR